MEPQEEIYIDDSRDTAVADMLVARYRNLSKEFFMSEPSIEIDFAQTIKDSAKGLSYVYPEHLSEIFIRYEEAPLFWIINNPIIKSLEDFNKAYSSKIVGLDSYKQIKEFYTKWAIIDSENEKRYFANSAINDIEKKTGRTNFLTLLFYSTILSYDKMMFNPAHSLELLEKTRELLTNLKLDEGRKEYVKYLISLYSGFLYLNNKNSEIAFNYFTDALTIKPDGITAKFYLLLTQVQLNRVKDAKDMVAEIFDYDLKRLEFAVSMNNLPMFGFLIDNPVFANFFRYYEFSSISDMIEHFLIDTRGPMEYIGEEIKAKVQTFKTLKAENYFDEEMAGNIAFLDSFIQKYSENKNLLCLAASTRVKQKFQGTVEKILVLIKQKFAVEIKNKLKIYDKELYQKHQNIENLKKELDVFKIKLQDKLESSIRSIEKRTADSVAILENRINNIYKVRKLNPRVAFGNAMTYNFILSITVFLMGGCAGYSNNYLGDIWRFNNVMAVIIVSGIKWGGLTFGIGLVISVVVAGLALMEGASQKQRLMQTITSLKNEKERQTEYLKKEAEMNEKAMTDRINKSIEETKKYIAELTHEKEEEEKRLNEANSELLAAEVNPLQALIE